VLLAGIVALVALPAATGAQGVSDSWLYNPLQVNAIDLQASDAAIASLGADPRHYVDAQITLHDGTTTYGPYEVGLRLKGQSSFRDLGGKAAFRISFGHFVAGQEFEGLKGLTLNNMVQDPSMIAEASSSIALTAIGVPTPRVGYAWVTLNGDVYGLYSDVETIDKEMAKRWFSSTQHIYEANYTTDVIPGDAGGFNVSVGSSKNTGDLDALIAAASGSTEGWTDRMKPLADLSEMARAFAAEHYIGQWDGYSYGSQTDQPNNFDLHSDDSGRFSMILTGTDQTWLDGENFGLTGNGVLFRECLAAVGCQPLYMAALRQIAANRVVANLATTARAIRAVIDPFRQRDPRLEESVAEGEAQADAKIALMAARPGQLRAWFGNGAESLAAASSSVRPLLGKPVGVPATPVSGRRFALSLPVTRSDNGKPLAAGQPVCSPTVRERPIRCVDSFKNGRMSASLTVPKATKGAELRVKIEVTAGTQTALGIYTFKIG
jgi:hypothetical protein